MSMATPAGWRPRPALVRLAAGAILALAAASLAASPLAIAQRERINPGLGPAPASIDRSTPARTWRSFWRAAAAGRFEAAAHCLDLTEVPRSEQEAVGVRAARQLFAVLKATGARPDAVREDTPVGPLEAGEPSNVVVAHRFRAKGVKGEVWLRRTADKVGPEPVWLATRRTVSSVAEWYRRIVLGVRVATAALNPGLGTPPASVRRDNPRAAVEGFLKACNAGRFAEAAHYLDLGGYPAAQQPAIGIRLARRLKIVLDRKLWINPEAISNDPGGAPEAGLPDEAERIGVIEVEGKKVPILLHRSFLPGGSTAWTFSRPTVAAIDRLYAAFGYGWLGDHLPAFFFTVKIAHVQLWQWCGIVLLLLAGWLFERVVSRPLLAGVHRAARKTATRWDDELAAALEGPVRLGLLAAFLFVTVPFLGLSGAAARTAAVVWKLLGIVFLGWLLSRWVSIAARFLEVSALAEHNEMARGFIPIFSRIVKVTVWGLAIVVGLDSIGIHVMGLVAGLGIGGMAVAFAAKDSIENVFGSLAIAADSPFKIGHFVKIGGVTGTVEAVGLRSTRVRTVERTLVTVPNATVISEVVENYSVRDRYRFQTTIGLLYDSTEAQLAYVIDETKKMLHAHPQVFTDDVRVRLARFGASSIDIDVLTWIHAASYVEFTAVAEELSFKILRIVRQSGTDFAFPSQTLYLARNSGMDEEAVRRVEEEVARRRAAGELWIPEPPQG